MLTNTLKMTMEPIQLKITTETILSIIAIIISIGSIIITWRIDVRQRQLAFFTEYTKRYQDIMIHLYGDENNKEAFHRLYFDLCSEEFYLYTKNYLPKDIWDRWVYGMKLSVKVNEIKVAWHRDEVYYDKYPEFKIFFNNVIKESETNKY